MRFKHPVAALLMLPLAAAPGCGGSGTVWVTGKVVKGGGTYAPPTGQTVTVTFLSMGGTDPAGTALQAGDPYQAEYDPASGTFKVPGPDGHGIPPGKYRIAVTQKLERAAFDAEKAKLKDRVKKAQFSRDADTLENRFGLSTSPIIVEVKGSEEVTVDLDTAPTSPARSEPARGRRPRT